MSLRLGETMEEGMNDRFCERLGERFGEMQRKKLCEMLDADMLQVYLGQAFNMIHES